MARTDENVNVAGASAPARETEGGDVKVDIEVEGDDVPKGTAAPKGQDATSAKDAAADVEATVIDDRSVAATNEGGASGETGASNEADGDVGADEQARIDAAIKAGEAAADADFKAEADGLRAERDELAKKLAGVADEIEAAKSEASASADKLARLQADWDNYRRRTERERVTERERACEGLIKDLLPAIDDLERAVEHASSTVEGDEVARQLVDGVSAVHAKVVAVLEKQGVEVIDPAGQPFDPQDHQAVGRVERPDVYDATVADVYQKGYRLGGKVVRPAMVTVTYGGAKRPADDKPDEGGSNK